MNIVAVIVSSFLIFLFLFLEAPTTAIIPKRITLEDSQPWSDEEPEPSVIAPFGKRIWNLIFDKAFFMLTLIPILNSFPNDIYSKGSAFFVMGVWWIIYYPMAEYTTGRTLAKLITQCRVVEEDNAPMELGTALKRNLLRFIPFDIFSFLKTHPVGWHDSLSGTRVVNSHRAADPVQWENESEATALHT